MDTTGHSLEAPTTTDSRDRDEPRQIGIVFRHMLDRLEIENARVITVDVKKMQGGPPCSVSCSLVVIASCGIGRGLWNEWHGSEFETPGD
jgi:hypothetical protein